MDDRADSQRIISNKREKEAIGEDFASDIESGPVGVDSRSLLKELGGGFEGVQNHDFLAAEIDVYNGT